MFHTISDRTADRMGALSTLIHDHQRVSELFERMQQSEDSYQRRVIFQEIKTELKAHSQLEEDILYPELERFDELAEYVESSYDEHQEIKDIIREIDDIEVEAEDMDPLQLAELRDELESAVEELIDVVSYHVEEEEENIFPLIIELMTVPELDRLEDSLTAEVANRKSSDNQAAA